MAAVDYYKILEISKTASPSDIRKAYREQARRWHPDKNPGKKEEADRRFKEISQAYEVLSDSQKRAVYDECSTYGDTRSDSSFKAKDFNFEFRDPNDVFREFFGDKDPFEAFFGDKDPFKAFFTQPGFAGMPDNPYTRKKTWSPRRDRDSTSMEMPNNTVHKKRRSFVSLLYSCTVYVLQQGHSIVSMFYQRNMCLWQRFQSVKTSSQNERQYGPPSSSPFRSRVNKHKWVIGGAIMVLSVLAIYHFSGRHWTASEVSEFNETQYQLKTRSSGM
jgi:curved DNA-binding protein CbpA